MSSSFLFYVWPNTRKRNNFLGGKIITQKWDVNGLNLSHQVAVFSRYDREVDEFVLKGQIFF